MNKAILMGRLTRDPELRQTGSGISVCTFTLAVDRRFKNQNGERQADFIPIVVWRQQAEFASQYFRQGSRVLVSGSIQVRAWDDRDGNRRYTTEVVADDLEFADSKRSDSSGSGYASTSPRTYENRPARAASAANDRTQNEQSFFSATDEDDDNGFFPAPSDDTDLPFDL